MRQFEATAPWFFHPCTLRPTCFCSSWTGLQGSCEPVLCQQMNECHKAGFELLPHCGLSVQRKMKLTHPSEAAHEIPGRNYYRVPQRRTVSTSSKGPNQRTTAGRACGLRDDGRQRLRFYPLKSYIMSAHNGGWLHENDAITWLPIAHLPQWLQLLAVVGCLRDAVAAGGL